MRPRFPGWCFNCRRFITRSLRSSSAFLCSCCFNALPQIDGSTCSHCGLAHAAAFCRESWAKHIDGFHSIFYYRDPVHRWIISHKYSGSFLAGRLLRGFVHSWFGEHAEQLRSIDGVVPVPIHPLRLRQRGFNQTAFLLNTQTVLPVRSGWLKKIRHTPQQAGLKEKERRENIREAFSASAEVKGRQLLVFDDVCTTGQTLGEVCACIKAEGAERIQVLTLSRGM